MAFGYGCENFSKFEEQGVGIQWHNIAKSPEDGGRYTFITSIIMMLIDAVLYWVLTWYIENVFPGIFLFLLNDFVDAFFKTFFWFVLLSLLCKNTMMRSNIQGHRLYAFLRDCSLKSSGFVPGCQEETYIVKYHIPLSQANIKM